MGSSILADGILLLHLLFIGVVVLCVPLIAVGSWRGWHWVHRAWFRLTHLAMIAFVATESILGMSCPLTLWESQLREASGGQGYDNEGFIASWLHRLIFFNFPHEVFTIMYVTYGLVVLGLFYLVPVRLLTKAA